jgi:MoaA/NifB/PqqE/SkfB family radical SAM enzyme
MSAPAKTEDRTFLARRYTSDTFVYNIDVVGTCNLACASCPVGNTSLQAVSRGPRPRGVMPFDQFSRILEKILRESPVERPVISVYNWGEPLLHPEIGRIVRLVRSHGLYCAVSTNLNQDRFLEDLVAAGPSNIKISLSGFTQGVYGRTHNKGQIETVKANMRRLRQLLDQHKASIDVFVGYHDYIGNDGDELAAMEALAQELGFGLRHKIARFAPIEKVLTLSNDEGVPEPADRRIFDLLLVKPAEWARVAANEAADGSCVMREQEMALNYDGSVALCCNVFDYANNVAPDFLTVGHDELQARKNRHELCGPCQKAGYPQSCGLDGHPEILRIAAARAREAATVPVELVKRVARV